MRLKIQTKKGPNLNEKTDPIRTQNQAFLRKNRPRKIKEEPMINYIHSLGRLKSNSYLELKIFHIEVYSYPMFDFCGVTYSL
jgi:hypothetical protein